MRHRILGIAFLLAIAMFLTLTVAIYRDAFGDYVKVTLKTDHIGNQLQTASDVKVRGLIVGTVKAVRTKGDGAELELALEPDKVGQIPQNVSARLLPKTLFGERYVNLVLPQQKTGAIKEGAVIEQDRSSSAIELERVLDDLMPVLQSIQPEKLASTLTALSQALDGRGKPLGQTLVSLDSYLGELNPQLPLLKENITKLADVSNVYSDAAPDLIQALNDMTVTSKTLVEQKQNLQTLYETMTTTSHDLTSFLAVNKNNLIQLNDKSRPTLELLAKYAPEYPCLLKQLTEFEPIISKVFGEGTDEPGLHITLEITQNRGKYVPGDEPEYKDKRGPRCTDIKPRPEPFPQYPPDGPVQDGSSKPPAARSSHAQNSTGTSAFLGAPSLANSPEEMELIAALFGPQVGVEYQQMPSWSALLLGPLARGTEVTVK